MLLVVAKPSRTPCYVQSIIVNAVLVCKIGARTGGGDGGGVVGGSTVDFIMNSHTNAETGACSPVN